MRSRPRRPPGRLALPPVPWFVLVAAAVVCALTALAVLRVSGGGSVAGSPARAEVRALLAAAATVPARQKVPGYQRSCDAGAGCVFGPAWTDDSTAPESHNGCPTRDDVLRRDLRGAGVDPADRCRPKGGVLVDPYTGRVVDTARTGLRGVHIDHVFPLAAAWDLGAARWPPERRRRFANDTTVNLLAVEQAVNEDKSDSTPGDWMPPDRRWWCFYAARYVTVAVTYSLPLTESDRTALGRAAERCP